MNVTPFGTPLRPARFIRWVQPVVGLAPAGVYPCRAQKKADGMQDAIRLNVVQHLFGYECL